MLVKRKNSGCYNCPLSGKGCAAYKKNVLCTFTRKEMWDACGHFVTAFHKGDVVHGEAVIKDNVVYCASATSTVYADVFDFVSLENVEVELCT